jgi:cytochrome c-type biogenesis protein CcmH
LIPAPGPRDDWQDMLLWFLFAVLTAAALAVVLAPLGRPPRADEGAEAGTLAVYRDQLDEIEAERARGLVDDSEALAARTEVSRRLLASADAAGSDAETPRATLPLQRAPVAMAVAVLVPLLTLALYLAQGSPGQPAYPMAGRAQFPLEQANVAELIAKVEARLRDHPEDGQGWDVIAPIYSKLGRFREAAAAFANAARIEGETVRRLAGFAEASVLAADGVVGEDARVAFEKILKIEPGRPEPRFWLTLAKEQDGKLADALADYKVLLSEASEDAPWRGAVQDRMTEVSRRLSGAGNPEPHPPGPSAADVAAAQKLAPEDRSRMIAQMVDGLAERLNRDGRDLAGWLRLVNAYAVLDRKDDARAALARARQHFPSDEKALAELAALAKNLGLGS